MECQGGSLLKKFIKVWFLIWMKSYARMMRSWSRHCVKSVQMRSSFSSVFSRIRIRKKSVCGHFSHGEVLWFSETLMLPNCKMCWYQQIRTKLHIFKPLSNWPYFSNFRSCNLTEAMRDLEYKFNIFSKIILWR